MTNTYRENEPTEKKISEEIRCIQAIGRRMNRVLNEGFIDHKIKENNGLLDEIRLLRCVLERILRVMDEGLFVDYQMEKFGKDFKMHTEEGEE